MVGARAKRTDYLYAEISGQCSPFPRFRILLNINLTDSYRLFRSSFAPFPHEGRGPIRVKWRCGIQSILVWYLIFHSLPFTRYNINVVEINFTCQPIHSFIITFAVLTLSALQTKIDSFANSVDPDETAHNEPSHLDLHCLPFCS